MKFTNKTYSFGLTLLLCLVTGVVFGKAILSQLYQPATNYVEVPSYIYVGGGIPTYTSDASAIIIGEVEEIGSIYYRGEGNAIPKQNANIDVKEVLKGDIGMGTITIIIDGETAVSGEHVGSVSFKQGEKVLLFIGKNNLGEYVPYAGPNGKYLIDENTNVISITGEKLSLTDVRTKISDALKNPVKISHSVSVPFSGEVMPE